MFYNSGGASDSSVLGTEGGRGESRGSLLSLTDHTVDIVTVEVSLTDLPLPPPSTVLMVPGQLIFRKD